MQQRQKGGSEESSIRNHIDLFCVQGLAKVLEKRPDIVLHGHSHKYGVTEQDGILFINPGSAGPARFKLPRTAAILKLQEKVRLDHGMQLIAAQLGILRVLFEHISALCRCQFDLYEECCGYAGKRCEARDTEN